MEKVALSLTAAALSPIFKKLEDKAASYFGGDITDKDIGKLRKNILPIIQTVIGATERIDADQLRPWLMELKDAAHEAEDVLDEYDYKAKANSIRDQVSLIPSKVSIGKAKAKLKKFLSPILLKTAMRSSLEKLQQCADEAKQWAPILGNEVLHDINSKMTPQQGNIGKENSTVSRVSLPVFGRDEERDAIIHALIPVDQEGSTSTIASKHNGGDAFILALCGIGGAGKTTLAQYVYNDVRVCGNFELKVWIHVSRAFDEYKITKQIIESISNGEFSPVGALDVVQRKLEELLKSKKFLIVLDDVWVEDRGRWDKMINPLKSAAGKLGSMILMTSRTKQVVLKLGVKSENIFSLKELKSSDCWSIMKYYVFGDASKDIEDKELQDVGDQIVSRFKNSPLAARIIGSSLAQSLSIERWKALLTINILKETMDVLYFSVPSPCLAMLFQLLQLVSKRFRIF